MKQMHHYILFSFLSGCLLLSCKKENKDVLVEVPTDIIFNDLQVDRFSFRIPDAPFSAGDNTTGIITANVKKNSDGTFSGFAISNKNWRSYPWNLSPDFAPATPLTAAQKKASIDSAIFSVYTSRPNQTGTFLVGYAKGDDAAITLQNPAVVEHVLVANNTYNYLLAANGSAYSGTLNATTQEYSLTGTKVRNIQIPSTSTDLYGRWYLPGPGDKSLIRLAGDEILAKRAAGKAAADAARTAGKTAAQVAADSTAAANALSKGYIKLIAEGYKGDSKTGSVEFYLAVRAKVNTANPTWDRIIADWYKMDLTALGQVNKIIFRMTSSYVDGSGNMLTPPYFCLDGIRIKK